MQKDALERLDLKKMLMEPELLESVDPDVHLVSTLISLNRVMPRRAKETARQVVRKVVEQLQKKLASPLTPSRRRQPEPLRPQPPPQAK